MNHTAKMMAMATTVLIGGASASPALAADNAMKVCGAKYQAAKAAKTIPAGETWNQYLAQCRSTLPKPAAKPGQPTAAQSAMYARERQCGAQWRADSAAKKVPAGQTWPQYWSACNKRMK
ncbi:MAG: hypothetical protein J0J06_09155 [Sphingomonas sp.]|uniref:hypothetical protein n=1 Tax=Sphingomonas sp. TaxID=28214 RepID=UPI001ACB715C|nr:hypothetical protein [Sphingomonas sp.]MBN8815600.1 hypothetical protein [Sphingomonas sp.]